MKRIAFNPRFVNDAGTDLVEGKVHSIRKNFLFWKKFEGQDVALFTWEGKPYRSKQRVFCIKRLMNVQVTVYDSEINQFWISTIDHCGYLPNEEIAYKDGFNSAAEFVNWFRDYPTGMMAVLHFSSMRY
jgi:hypothetical protein